MRSGSIDDYNNQPNQNLERITEQVTNFVTAECQEIHRSGFQASMAKRIHYGCVTASG
jgi:hypothetical protein